MAISDEYLLHLNTAGQIITLQERTRQWHIGFWILGTICVALGALLVKNTDWGWLLLAYGVWLVFAAVRVRKARASQGLVLAAVSCLSLCVGILFLQGLQLTSPKPRVKPGALIVAFFAGKFAFELWGNRTRLRRLALIAEQDPMVLERTQQLADDAAREAPHLLRLSQNSLWWGGKQWYLLLQGDVVGIATFTRKSWKRMLHEVFWVRRSEVAIQPMIGQEGKVNARIAEIELNGVKVQGEAALSFAVR